MHETIANTVKVATWSDLEPLQPAYALVANVDLVVIRWKDEEAVSVLFGRCQHRGALMADGFIRGQDIVCGVHNWDYSYKTGISSYNNEERLHPFNAWIADDAVWVDEDEIRAWEKENPQSYNRDDGYQGLYADLHGTPDEPYNKLINELATYGLERSGHHGQVSAMGISLTTLPRWEDIQFVTAQLARLPKLDDEPVGTDLVIGPRATKPLVLDIPLFVSDMSFGALSEEAKVSLAQGAEMAGTGICSGEGGMLPEEQEANSRYFYELASARFGFRMELLKRVQAFHFKGGQGARPVPADTCPATR